MVQSLLRCAALALLLGCPHAATAGDIAAGRAAFEPCAACHQTGPGAANAVGPQLNGILGRAAASAAGFDYSDALNEAAAAGLTWTRETLDAFIADPRGFLSGTRMAFAGISDGERRQDLIAFLATLEADFEDAR